MMKLTAEDRLFLKEQCHEDEASINQIERAARRTKYEYYDPSIDDRCHRIGVDKVISLVGREQWLIGMDRSAFHWSATIEVPGKERVVIFFDSSAFFRE